MLCWLTPDNLTAFQMTMSEERYAGYMRKLDLLMTDIEAVLVFLCHNQEALLGYEVPEGGQVSMNDAYSALIAYKIDNSDEQAMLKLFGYYLVMITTKGYNIDLNSFINTTCSTYQLSIDNRPMPDSDGLLIIPDGLSVIDSGVYEGNEDIQSLRIGNDCVAICDRAFSGCKNLDNIVFGNRLTFIDMCAFSGIAANRLTFPPTLRRICENAFENCEYLISVSFNEGLRIIGKAAFRGVSRISRIELPPTVEILGDQAFALNTSLTSINLDNVKSIGSRCFAMCRGLTELHIGANTTELGERFAEGCTALTDIYLPAKITVVHTDAFAGIPKSCKMHIASENGETSLLPYVVGKGVNYEVV